MDEVDVKGVLLEQLSYMTTIVKKTLDYHIRGGGLYGWSTNDYSDKFSQHMRTLIESQSQLLRDYREQP